MMAFIEDIAQAPLFVVACRWSRPRPASPGAGLRDDQRMIGHHDAGMAGAADGALDEADAVMRAGGIDAFAAPVGDGGKRHGGGQKGGKADAGQIAVGVGGNPARDQAPAPRVRWPGANAVRFAASSKFKRQR